MNKQWLAVASGLIALVGVWLWLSGEPAPVETTATEAAPSESVGSATDPAAPEGAASPDSASSDESSPFAVSDEAAGANDSAADATVGSDVNDVDTDLSAVEPDTPAMTGSANADSVPDTSPELATDVDPSTDSAADGDTEPSRSSGPAVAVPESYPVTDAARYFVPKEERRPGNLGGPPPLDFPGGPSDPNRESEAGAAGGFAPPPSPGQ